MRSITITCCTACILSILVPPTVALADFAVFPKDIRLTGIEARQHVLVQHVDQQLTSQAILPADATWTIASEAIAKVDNGIVTPVANGATTLTVTFQGTSHQIPIVVEKTDVPYRWSFRNQVESILTKAGCNSGACHGAVAGKNGFKLSLRGYDSLADFMSITRHARGRRIVTHDPGKSLILTKATGAVPHKGGVRFTEDSLEYRVLADWIASGQPGPQEDDPRIDHLEVLPKAIRLKPGDKQSLVVIAHFQDGHREDVTPWVKYSASNHTVCTVTDQGEVNVNGNGEGAIVAWYLAQNAVTTVTVPFNYEIQPKDFATGSRNPIDVRVNERLKSLRIPPSLPCTDGEFLRRTSLDTAGILPTLAETKAFLADTDPLKRQKLVDRLLASPEYVDYWTYQWSDLLLVSGKQLRPDAVKAYSKWIRQHVEQNSPWDKFVREVILSTGSNVENGAVNFYTLHQDPLVVSETMSMAFLGMSINCARCHDHPLEKWTNDDYYGLASMFSRVRGKGWGGDFRSGDGVRTVYVVDQGEVIQPRSGKPQPPRPLDGNPIPFESEIDRRIPLADWLTSPKNPYFSRAIVNRVWANFMGVGLVDAVDDLRLTNPASHPDLHEELAAELARQNFDLKWLMRSILLSETYQRSSATRPENQADTRFYSHFNVRRLRAEVLLDAFSQVTEVPTTFKDVPPGTRALQLADANITSYFLDTFGRPERVLTCACERVDSPSMTQILHLNNGITLTSKLEAATGRVAAAESGNTPAAELAQDLFLSSLCRNPTENELRSFTEELEKADLKDRRQVLEDLVWSVLTSREFLFQH